MLRPSVSNRIEYAYVLPPVEMINILNTCSIHALFYTFSIGSLSIACSPYGSHLYFMLASWQVFNPQVCAALSFSVMARCALNHTPEGLTVDSPCAVHLSQPNVLMSGCGKVAPS